MDDKAWSGFDMIVCVHYAPHSDRKASLTKELNRVGMGGKVSWHTTSSSTVNATVYKSLQYDRFGLPPTVGQFNAAMAHHEVIRSAYDEGVQSLLIIENDIRFLKDAERAKRIVAAWKDTGCDLVMFDRFLWTNNTRAFTAGGERFVLFDGNVRGGSCYALTREGMRCARDAFLDAFTVKRRVMIGDTVYDLMPCKKCFSETCACVQKEFDGNLNATACGTSQYEVYKKDGVNLGDYNL